MPTLNKYQTCIYGCSSNSNLRYFYKYLGKRKTLSAFDYHKKHFINILYPPICFFKNKSVHLRPRRWKA